MKVVNKWQLWWTVGRKDKKKNMYKDDLCLQEDRIGGDQYT